MGIITINDTISYVAASDDPLSAEIGIVRDGGDVWLYDVGNGEKAVSELTGSYHIVLSHFHADHAGNVARLRAEALYVSGETFRHVHQGTIVRAEKRVGDLRIFPLPSSHTKGCLGLEVGERFAFVGDALYSKVRDGFYIYNAQLLKDEIAVLRALRAPWLLVSHFSGFVRERAEVLEELETIYGMREKSGSEIRVPIAPE